MSKTLSLVLTDESREALALRAAVAIALREDAHLDIACLGLEPLPMEVMPMASPRIIVQAGRAEAQARAEALASWCRAQLPPGLRASIEPRTVLGVDLAARAALGARFSDLCVASRPYGRDRGALAGALAAALLFGTGVPVLFVPDREIDWSRPFRRVALAWNDSGEALRAARSTLGFLRAAERVEIAIVDPPAHAADRSDPGGPLALWLSRHGVRAEVAVLARSQPRVADLLARFARERGCDALVMGAYGHSPLREAALGGATRDMLSEVPLPVIMAH